jgi:DNA polymerase-3 subunit delta'
MDLEDLPQISTPLAWQAQEWLRLTEQMQAGQLPHAILLAGAEHTGKSQLAVALARMLLCAAPRDGLNCGECRSCQFSRTGAHGDFLWVAPVQPSRVIKIDQVRATIRFTNNTAGYGERKVIVFAPADTMNINAYNALLKSLEEPAENTHLMLVCDRTHGIPATIRSRCQIYRLPAPDESQALEWLQNVTGDKDAAQQMLRLANGRPMLARQLWLSGDAEAMQTRLLALRALLEGKLAPAEAAGLWSDEDIGQFIEYLTCELQAALRALPADNLRGRKSRALFGLLDELGHLQAALDAGANPNKQLFLDAMLAKLHSLLGDRVQGDKISGQTGGAAYE